MGIESDQEIIQMIGIEEEVMNYFAATIEEGNMLQIYTKVQVLRSFVFQAFALGIELNLLFLSLKKICNNYRIGILQYEIYFSSSKYFAIFLDPPSKYQNGINFDFLSTFNIFNFSQAMTYLASKIRQRQVWTKPMSKMDECKQLIHKTLLAHVPVSGNQH